MHAEQGAISDLVTPWIIFYVIACVVSLITTFVNLKIFYKQLRWAHLHMCAGVTWTGSPLLGRTTSHVFRNRSNVLERERCVDNDLDLDDEEADHSNATRQYVDACCVHVQLHDCHSGKSWI